MGRRRLVRVIVMPLVILAVAGGLMLWQSHTRQEQIPAVRDFVEAVINDARAGRDLAPRLAADGSALAGPLSARLRDVLDRAGDRPVAIAVTAGDTDQAGPAASGATHTAMLHVGDEPVLGLRIAHDRRPVIIGFWTP